MIVLAAVSAILILASMLRTRQAGPAGGGLRRGLAVAGLAIVPAVAILLAWWIPGIPWGLNAYGRQMASWENRLAPGVVDINDVPRSGGSPDIYCTYMGEGMNVSIAVTDTTAGVRSLPRRRQGPGFERLPGHAAPAHAGTRHRA